MKKASFAYKTVNRFVGKAVHLYDMIADGDKIAVGLSGGKDSYTLLFTLFERQKRAPISYELFPIYIDPGYGAGQHTLLRHFCRDLGLQLSLDITDFGIKAHGSGNRENPCFLCSRLRRQRLFEIADNLGCRKVALGHNKDDLIETLFLNLLYSGEMSAMSPSQSFFSGRFTIIRPLAYTEARYISKVAEQKGFPVFENPCPSAKNSKRTSVRDLLGNLYQSNRKIKGNIFRAMRRNLIK